MSQTVFTANTVLRELGSSVYSTASYTLSISSGTAIPAGAIIQSASITFSSVRVYGDATHSHNYTEASLDGDQTGIGVGAWNLSIWPYSYPNFVSRTRSLRTDINFWKNKTSLNLRIGYWTYRSSYVAARWMDIGTGTVSITVNWSGASTATCSTSVTADGSHSIDVSITRVDSQITHTVNYSFGSATHTSTAVATSDSYIIPITWCNQIPNSSNGTVAVTVTSYNGSDVLGSVTLYCTLYVPDNIRPSLGATVNFNATKTYNGQFLQGYTTFTPSIVATYNNGNYGATVSGAAITFDGIVKAATISSISNYQQTISTTSAFTYGTAGTNLPCTITISDTRGRTASVTTNFNIYSYQTPTITWTSSSIGDNDLYRCNSSHEGQIDGTYLAAKITNVTYTATIGGYSNTWTSINVSKADSGSSTYTSVINITSISSYPHFAYSSMAVLDAQKTYSIKVTITDQVGATNTYYYNISSAAYKMYIKIDSDKHIKGVAFGGAVQHDESFEIPSNWSYRRGNALMPSLDDIYPIGSIYMSVDSANPGTKFGGTWEQIQNRFLLSAGSTYTAGTTGGSATMDHTHNISEHYHPMGHNHTEGTLRAAVGAVAGNVNNIGYVAAGIQPDGRGPATCGAYSFFVNSASSAEKTFSHYTNVYGTTAADSLNGFSWGAVNTRSASATPAWSGTATNNDNMPPYLVVYMWKRTA